MSNQADPAALFYFALFANRAALEGAASPASVAENVKT